MILPAGRSQLGAFIRSALGVRTAEFVCGGWPGILYLSFQDLNICPGAVTPSLDWVLTRINEAPTYCTWLSEIDANNHRASLQMQFLGGVWRYYMFLSGQFNYFGPLGSPYNWPIVGDLPTGPIANNYVDCSISYGYGGTAVVSA